MRNYRRMKSSLLLFATLFFGIVQQNHAQLWQGNGRIAISSDGNQHDSDDWGATAVSLAIIANRGLQDKLVHYDYANHVWNNDTFFENQIIESALGAADRFGFDRSKFHNGFRNRNAAINSIKNAINVSSASNPLFFIVAGPMEIPYQGVLAANANKRQFVTFISHSIWNDHHGDCDDGRDWTECHPGSHHKPDIIALGAKWQQISDQNANKFSPGSDAAWSFLNRLNGQFDAAYEWTYSRVVAVRTPGDASDAGMAYYLFTGDQNGNTSKLETLMKSPPIGGGTGGNTGGDTGGGSGSNVTFKGQSSNKFISSENGGSAMIANRTAAQGWEKFAVQSAGNGTVSIKGNNGKYVSSENGAGPMNCNRSTVGAWEKFTLESLGGNLYAIKGNNGKYVSHENGNGPINCNRNAVGAWEKFVIEGLSSSKIDRSNVGLLKDQISFFPIPVTGDDFNLRINAANIIESASVEFMDITGKLVFAKELGALDKGMNSFSLQGAREVLTKGVYIAKVDFGEESSIAKIVVN